MYSKINAWILTSSRGCYTRNRLRQDFKEGQSSKAIQLTQQKNPQKTQQKQGHCEYSNEKV